MEKRYWQDGVTLLAGAWLFFSPYALHYNELNGVAAWNALVVGLGVVMMCGVSLVDPRMMPKSPKLVAAVWLVLSPWILRYSHETQLSAIWNQVVTGIVIGFEASWVLIARRHQPAQESA
jgi:SPW repeat